MLSLEVQNYLRQYANAEDALRALKENFGINASQHKSLSKLYSLKYDQIDVEKLGVKSHPIVRECRGLILDSTLNTWKVVAHPFNRFYNLGEHQADDINWDTATVWEKLDGSLMILYYHANRWHVASSGTPDAGGPLNRPSKLGSDGGTYADLFWQTLGSLVGWTFMDRCLWRLPKNVTFMFELCSPENRIVVRHKEPRLILIGCRNIQTGEEKRPGEYIHMFPGVEHPRVFPVSSVKEAVRAVSDMNGEEQEGFVVCDSDFHRVKIKAPNYVALHHLANNVLSTRRVFQDIVFKGEVDEVAAIFPEHAETLETARTRYNELIADLAVNFKKGREAADDAQSKGLDVKKAFALAVKDSRCSGALFALNNGSVNGLEDFIQNKLHIDNLLRTLGYK